MKLEANLSPRVLQMSGSVARLLTCFLLFVALLAICPMGTLRAAPSLNDTIKVIKELAQQKNISDGDYSAAVAKLVKADPKDAEAIIAEAVKDKPPYACDVVKAGILALMPEGGAQIDPKLVAAIVADVVQTIQATNPEIVEQVISCALDVDKDAGPAILNALAGIYNGPYGPNRPPGTFGGGVPPGVGHKPTPFPTPPPVTPFKPI